MAAIQCTQYLLMCVIAKTADYIVHYTVHITRFNMNCKCPQPCMSLYRVRFASLTLLSFSVRSTELTENLKSTQMSTKRSKLLLNVLNSVVQVSTTLW